MAKDFHFPDLIPDTDLKLTLGKILDKSIKVFFKIRFNLYLKICSIDFYRQKRRKLVIFITLTLNNKEFILFF